MNIATDAGREVVVSVIEATELPDEEKKKL